MYSSIRYCFSAALSKGLWGRDIKPMYELLSTLGGKIMYVKYLVGFHAGMRTCQRALRLVGLVRVTCRRLLCLSDRIGPLCCKYVHTEARKQ